MAVISDDHNAEAGEAALRQIVAMVSQIGGPEALEDLAVELALKVAELVEHIASDQHLPAADVADILFID
jgi:chemotaxis response regulator CheB